MCSIRFNNVNQPGCELFERWTQQTYSTRQRETRVNKSQWRKVTSGSCFTCGRRDVRKSLDRVGGIRERLRIRVLLVTRRHPLVEVLRLLRRSALRLHYRLLRKSLQLRGVLLLLPLHRKLRIRLLHRELLLWLLRHHPHLWFRRLQRLLIAGCRLRVLQLLTAVARPGSLHARLDGLLHLGRDRLLYLAVVRGLLTTGHRRLTVGHRVLDAGSGLQRPVQLLLLLRRAVLTRWWLWLLLLLLRRRLLQLTGGHGAGDSVDGVAGHGHTVRYGANSTTLHRVRRRLLLRGLARGRLHLVVVLFTDRVTLKRYATNKRGYGVVSVGWGGGMCGEIGARWSPPRLLKRLQIFLFNTRVRKFFKKSSYVTRRIYNVCRKGYRRIIIYWRPADLHYFETGQVNDKSW